MKQVGAIIIGALLLCQPAMAQNEAYELVKKLKAKIDRVNDYEVDAKIKLDISFIKAPLFKAKVYFKKPDKIRIKREGGIVLLPKNGLHATLLSMLAANNFTAIGAGTAQVHNQPVTVVKLLPNDENSDIVLITLWIDEKQSLVRKAATTNRENGTYLMEMHYGQYADWALPDAVTFTVNVKDYNLPKALTIEFNDLQAPPQERSNLKMKKGKIEIYYRQYQINKGLPDELFHKDEN